MRGGRSGCEGRFAGVHDVLCCELLQMFVQHCGSANAVPGALQCHCPHVLHALRHDQAAAASG
jgi:hypothetical protein